LNKPKEDESWIYCGDSQAKKDNICEIQELSLKEQAKVMFFETF